jgi:hypothetical protein
MNKAASVVIDVALAAAAVWVIATEAPRALPGAGLLDFGSFVASGAAARDGLDPYGIYPLTFHVSFPGFDAWNPNLNPPISALLFQLFGLADPHTAFRVWWGVSVACYALTLLLLVRRYGGDRPLVKLVWALALAGFWDTLVLGQIYLPLVLAAIGSLLLLERGSSIAAGVLIGIVVSIKPNFLVWPGVLLLAGHWRPALAGGITSAIIAAIPLALYGPEVYRQWLALVTSDADRVAFLTNASLAGLAARLGAPSVGLVLSVLLLAGASAWSAWRRPDVVRASELGIAVALLASPLAWIHYTLFLLPFLMARWHSLPSRLVAALLIVPVPFILGQFGTAALTQATLGSLYNWALILFVLLVAGDAFLRQRQVAPEVRLSKDLSGERGVPLPGGS